MGIFDNIITDYGFILHADIERRAIPGILKHPKQIENLKNICYDGNSWFEKPNVVATRWDWVGTHSSFKY